MMCVTPECEMDECRSFRRGTFAIKFGMKTGLEIVHVCGGACCVKTFKQTARPPRNPEYNNRWVRAEIIVNNSNYLRYVCIKKKNTLSPSERRAVTTVNTVIITCIVNVFFFFPFLTCAKPTPIAMPVFGDRTHVGHSRINLQKSLSVRRQRSSVSARPHSCSPATVRSALAVASYFGLFSPSPPPPPR